MGLRVMARQKPMRAGPRDARLHAKKFVCEGVRLRDKYQGPRADLMLIKGWLRACQGVCIG